MIKKSVLLLVIFFVVGLTFAYAQDIAKLEQLQKELEQIETRVEARGGQATPQEQQRLQQIRQEIIQAAGPYGGMMQQQTQQSTRQSPTDANKQAADIERQVKQQEQNQQQALQAQQKQREEEERRQREAQMYPGDKRGWPPNAAFTDLSLKTPVKQPNGTKASYNSYQDNNKWYNITIYLTGGNSQTVMQDLIRQVEASTGKKMAAYDSYYSMGMPPVIKGYTGISVAISLADDGAVEFSIRHVADGK